MQLSHDVHVTIYDDVTHLSNAFEQTPLNSKFVASLFPKIRESFLEELRKQIEKKTTHFDLCVSIRMSESSQCDFIHFL